MYFRQLRIAVLGMIKNMREILSKALKRVGQLEGVRPAHGKEDDDLAIKAGHFNDYLLVYYLGQLIERGELELLIQEDRKEYLYKLLHLEV